MWSKLAAFSVLYWGAFGQFTCGTGDPSNANRTWAVGEIARFCLHFGPQNTKVVFGVGVDTVTTFSPKNAFKNLKSQDTDLSFQFQDTGLVSKKAVD